VRHPLSSSLMYCPTVPETATSPSVSEKPLSDSIRRSLDMLECPICLEFMLPPIFQCREGHTFCSDCKQHLNACPTCRGEIEDIRCRVLESIAESLDDMPCKYLKFGCRACVNYSSKKEHESNCTYRPFKCSDINVSCSFEGPSDALVHHLTLEHRYEHLETNQISFTCTSLNATVYSSSTEEPFNCQYLWQKQIYSCFDKHFILRILRKVDFEIAQFHISLLALHSKHHCHRYAITAQGNHRKFSFEGPVWTIRKGFKEVERVRDCLILPENIALFLSGSKGSEKDLTSINLVVTGEIMRQ